MTIACIGDSVTHGGQNGYVELLQLHFNENYPDLGIQILNWGKSSETITGLTEVGHPGPRPYLFDRLDQLLKDTPIDAAIFCYGINCGIYGEPSTALFDSYSRGIGLFLDKMGQHGIGAILLTPPPLAIKAAPIPIDTDKEYTWMNPNPEYDKEVLQEFKRIVLEADHESIWAKIDIHTPLSLQQTNCYDKDPIHPNSTGHRLISATIVENMGI